MYLETGYEALYEDDHTAVGQLLQEGHHPVDEGGGLGPLTYQLSCQRQAEIRAS